MCQNDRLHIFYLSVTENFLLPPPSRQTDFESLARIIFCGIYAVMYWAEELILLGEEAGNYPSLPLLLCDSSLIRPADSTLNSEWNNWEKKKNRVKWIMGNHISLIGFYFNNRCNPDAMILRTSCVLKISRRAASCFYLSNRSRTPELLSHIKHQTRHQSIPPRGFQSTPPSWIPSNCHPSVQCSRRTTFRASNAAELICRSKL